MHGVNSMRIVYRVFLHGVSVKIVHHFSGMEIQNLHHGHLPRMQVCGEMQLRPPPAVGHLPHFQKTKMGEARAVQWKLPGILGKPF
jgi:hypothetical protein